MSEAFSFLFGGPHSRWLPSAIVGLIVALTQVPGKGQGSDLIRLGPTGEVAIPFQLENDFLVLNVLMNGRMPLRFIMDTGAENTILLDKSIADDLDVTYRRRFTVMGSDREQELTAWLATGIELQFDDALLARHRTMLVLEENYADLDRVVGSTIHGILGADFLMRFVVEIDYRKRRVVLHEPGQYTPPARFTRVPATFVRNRPYLQLPISFTERLPTDRKLLLDTGASITLLLHTFGDSLKTEDLPIPTVPSYIASGIGGQVTGNVGRASSILLGRRTLEDVVTYFQPIDTAKYELPAERDGILGNKVLQRYTVVIDYIHERVYVKGLGRAVRRKFKYDRSGLAITAGGPRLQRYYVARVIPGSPAEAAGVRAGDRITAVNGTSTTFLGLGSIVNRLQGKVGRRIKIKFVRGQRYYRAEFRLRELI